MRWIRVAAGLLCAWVAPTAAVVQHEVEGIVYVPGRPNTVWVPDPSSALAGRPARPLALARKAWMQL